MRKRICFVVLAATCPTWCFGATNLERIQSAAQDGKTTYVMFYRSNDATTQNMAKSVQTQVAESSNRAAWVAVNVNDKSQSALVKRFDATRIPLPTVFGLAPNGAVSGVYRVNVNREQLETAILTPKYADMVKSLQEQRIAVVCLLPAHGGAVPAGVPQLENDVNFHGRTHRVTAAANEQAETSFFQRMRIATDIKSPVVLLFAPPGVHLGTFDANVSGAALAQTLHSSGKCDCTKCRH
jgi:hypothetical protein